MKSRTICLVIPSLQPGGMERVMAELAGFFCMKNEFEVHMVMFGKKPEVFYRVPDSLIIHEPATPFNNKFRSISAIGRLLFLRKKIKSLSPVSVMSFGEYWNNLVLLALFGLNIRVYVSDRCQPDMSLGPFHNLLRKLLYPRAAGVIVQTMAAKEIYKQMLPDANLKVIGNPIRTIQKGPDEKRENLVLSVGMLIKTKHFDDLIRLFAEINPVEWKLVIAGDDALRQNNKIKLEALAKELNIEDRVIFTGLLSDVDTLYKRSKIFAFASTSEGFPNVIGEAMAAGLSVVAFDCVAGPGEMISDGKDGFLVAINNYKQLKEKLLVLMNDHVLRESFGNEASRSIKRYSVNIIGEEYYSFISAER